MTGLDAFRFGQANPSLGIEVRRVRLPLNIQGWAILRHPTPDAPRNHPRELKVHLWGLETRENPLSGEATASPGCPELLAHEELPMSDVLATTNGEGIRVHIPQPHMVGMPSSSRFSPAWLSMPWINTRGSSEFGVCVCVMLSESPASNFTKLCDVKFLEVRI